MDLELPLVEAAVLGAAIWRPREAASWDLSPELFADSDNQDVCRAWQAAADAAPDDGYEDALQPTWSAMRAAGALREESLQRLLSYPQDSGDSTMVDELRECARRRQMRNRVVALAELSERKPPASVMRAMQETIDAMSDGDDAKLLRPGDVARAALTRVSLARETFSLGALGLRRLSMHTGAIPGGSLVVIGADTGVGKSSIILAILGALSDMNRVCGYVSYEDSAELWGIRLLARQSGVSAWRMASGSLSPEEIQTVDRAAAEMQQKCRVLSQHPIGGTEDDAIGAMRAMAREGARVVAIDYLQAIRGSSERQDRRNEIREIVSRLKGVATGLNVVLVLASQLSRPQKAQQDHRIPTRHDLKEAGDIENAAEAVVLAWKDPEDRNRIFVRLDKLKWGPGGKTWTMSRRAQYGGCLVEDE